MDANNNELIKAEDINLSLIPNEITEIDPLTKINKISRSIRKRSTKNKPYNFDNGLHYYEDNGIMFINVDKEDEIIDNIRSSLLTNDQIREYIDNGEFEQIKKYIPEKNYKDYYIEYIKYCVFNDINLPEKDSYTLYITTIEKYNNNKWLENKICYVLGNPYNTKFINGYPFYIQGVSLLNKFIKCAKNVCFI